MYKYEVIDGKMTCKQCGDQRVCASPISQSCVLGYCYKGIDHKYDLDPKDFSHMEDRK